MNAWAVGHSTSDSALPPNVGQVEVFGLKRNVILTGSSMKCVPGCGLLLFLIFFIACHTPEKSTTPLNHLGPALPFHTVEELLQKAQRVNDDYNTLSTVHRVTIEIALGGKRTEKRSFRGVLALRRPGNFRLYLLGPLEIKLIDLGYVLGRVKTYYVSPELSQSSRLPKLIESIAGDIAAIFKLDPPPPTSRRELAASVNRASDQAPLYVIKEYNQNGDFLREMTFLAATLARSQMKVFDQPKHSRIITYGDYETNGTLLIPRSIHLTREGPLCYWLTIRVESVLFNQPLDERLFQ